MEHIYKIKFPSGKVYIGKAIDTHERWNQHKSSAHKGTLGKLYQGMRNEGISNLEFEILGEYPSDTILDKEAEFIEKYDAVDSGYNTVRSAYQPNSSKPVAVIEICTKEVFETKKDAEARFKLRKQALSHGGVNGIYNRKRDGLVFIEIETYNDLKGDELSHWEDVASCYNEFRRLKG